jgi:hypothetical protein
LFGGLAERLMLAVKMTIMRYLSDEPQPGIVECELVDAHARRWIFVEKTAVVSAEYLDSKSGYPRPVEIAVEVVERMQDSELGEVVRIDTDRPWGIQSVGGETRFEVFPASLVEV